MRLKRTILGGTECDGIEMLKGDIPCCEAIV